MHPIKPKGLSPSLGFQFFEYLFLGMDLGMDLGTRVVQLPFFKVIAITITILF